MCEIYSIIKFYTSEIAKLEPIWAYVFFVLLSYTSPSQILGLGTLVLQTIIQKLAKVILAKDFSFKVNKVMHYLRKFSPPCKFKRTPKIIKYEIRKVTLLSIAMWVVTGRKSI